MRKKWTHLLVAGIPLLLIAMGSCKQQPNSALTPESTEGWKPIYGTNEVFAIKAESPRKIERGGKIYTRGNILYQIEQNKGIHVIDIATPATPQKLKFISITGVQDMAIKGSYLYANNLNDLVIADMSNLNDVKEVNRVPSAFHVLDQNVPPTSGYFECVDASKGMVVGWERATLKHPECVRN